MDINKIKNKLASFQQNQNGTPNKEKKNNFWKAPIGKSVIRVVPSAFNADVPFTELLFYYVVGDKTIISPKNFGEKDPIAEFVQTLRKTNDKDNWRLAKKLEPKMRVFVPIIVRGKEDEGVKLWQFGKEVYMQFLNLADNEDIGDYTDVKEGRDIVVDTLGPESTKTAYNKSSISPKIKTTPLTEDKVLLEKWLTEQPNPKEIYQRLSFDEIKNILQQWLTPTSEEGEEEEEVEEEEVSTTSVSSNGSKGKGKFDNLFKDDKD